MPIKRPATTAGTRYWNRPRMAAASAGTMNSVYEIGTSGAIGAMRMPDRPATMALIIQFAAATRSGAMPLRNAPFSLSAAARVASPNRVNRNDAAIAKARPSTVTANQTRSLDTLTEPNIQILLGRIPATFTGVVPSRSPMTPVSTTITPIDATARATAGAVRKGRNTTTYSSNPSTAEMASVSSIAGQNPR